MEFIKAKPIWLEGLEKEMNLQAGFKAKLVKEEGKTYQFKIAVGYIYRLFINGEFVCYGPARAAHGYARVDRVDITEKLACGENILAVETVGYNVNTYYLINQPAFVCCEVECDGEAVIATGYDFNGLRLYERVQKCHRYSFQRPFPDVWKLSRENPRYNWTVNDVEFESTQLVDVDIKFLERKALMPDFDISAPGRFVERGVFESCEIPGSLKIQSFYKGPEADVLAFPIEEIEFAPPIDYYRNKKIKVEAISPDSEVVIREGEYALVDMSRNYTGFLKMQIVALKDSQVVAAMDEVLKEGAPDPAIKMGTNATVGYQLEESINTYDIESFECYGFRYALVMVTKGEIVLKSFAVREYVYPMHNVPALETDDEVLQNVYKAAVETYRQNVVDIYMDCPTRERAGWLCDSYYTAQSEWHFTGDCKVEDDFVENFMLYRQRDGIPDGMLPMCYPADHYNKNFIPQWAIWFVLELEQYLKRNKTTNKENYKKLCYDLLDFFARHENAEGLTEKLPGWNFIEWSKANQWTKDVNYPTNMMYARLMEITGNLYGDSELIEKCEKLRGKIMEKSFDGELFVDNAVYNEEGVAVNTGNRSEVCQYYAIFFGLIKDLNDPKFAFLKDAVFNVFGPLRKEKGLLPDVEYANALMGIYIRMELLYNFGEYEMLLEEIKLFFGKMADLTGTLWENNAVCASLNHGFASFAGIMAYKALEKIK